MPKKNKKNKVKYPTVTIDVIDETYWTVTREADPDDEWDNDDTHEDHHIQGIKRSKDEWGDLTIGFEVEENVPYYLICVFHSHGDSFSHHSGALEFVGLYKTEAKADKAAQIIDDNGTKPCSIKTETGQTLTLPGWDDYFGGFDYVEVETVYLKG